jgi:hypothetical protein
MVSVVDVTLWMASNTSDVLEPLRLDATVQHGSVNHTTLLIYVGIMQTLKKKHRKGQRCLAECRVIHALIHEA